MLDVFERQQRQIEKIARAAGRVELVLDLALALPAKTAALPDIGPTLTAGGFGGAFFKGILLASGVGGGGSFCAEQVAQIVKMRLPRNAFGQVGGVPDG